MTEHTVVQFETERLADIPRIGQRKRVRVNGRPETLYVRSLDVRVFRDVDNTRFYRGSYTLVPLQKLDW